MNKAKMLGNLRMNFAVSSCWRTAAFSRRLLLGLAFLILLSSQGLTIPILDSAYENIKEQAIQSLSGTFNRKITVKEASGRILGQIVLNEVHIGRDLYFDQFIINFNPIKYAMNKGDIMPAITSLRLVGGHANIVRGKNGKISIADILRTDGKGPPFKAIINFEGIEISYKDEEGLPYKKKAIETMLQNAKGTLDLRKTPKVKIAISAAGQDVASVGIIGEADIKNNSYKLKINAKQMSAKSFGNYFAPFFNFKKGYADVDLLASNDNLILDVNGNVDDIPISVKGKVYNSLDVSIKFKNASAKYIKANIPELRNFDVQGVFGGDLKIVGLYSNPKITTSVTLEKGKAYNVLCSILANFDYADNVCTLKESEINAFGGKISYTGSISFKGGQPKYSINGKASSFDVTDFTSKTSGIKGQFNGTFKLDGNASRFIASIDGNLANASFWGEPVNKLSAKVLYENGGLAFEKIRIASKQGEFLGKGTMTSGKTFSLEAKAKGITLRGTGILGQMELKVKSFAGTLSFTADENFLRSPIKNLTANGSVEISQGKIGSQTISEGAGEIFIDHGAIYAKNIYLKQGKTIVGISGQTGPGIDTDLMIEAKQANLEDFGILANLSQIDMENTFGKGYVSVHAKGHLYELSQLTDLLNLDLDIKAGFSNGMFSGTQIRIASLEAEISEGKLKNSNFYVKTYFSNLSGYLKISKEKIIQSRIKGMLDLSDLMPITARYGMLKGAGEVDFWALGPETNLQSNLNLNFSNLSFNDILFDSVNTGLTYNNKQNLVFFSKPLNVVSGKTNLSLNGSIYIPKNPSDAALNLDLSLSQSDAENTVHLLYDAYCEITKVLKPVLEDKTKIEASVLTLKTWKIGKYNYSSEYFKEWDDNSNALDKFKKAINAKFVFDRISGQASGRAKITGTLQNPKADMGIIVDSGAYGRYNFDKLEMQAAINPEGAAIKKGSIKKGGGQITAQGFLSFASKHASIEISANELPIDILNLAIPGEFHGNFSGAGNILGNILSPSYSVRFVSKPINVKGIDFSRAEGLINGNQNILNIGKLIFTEKDKVSSMSGQINLNGDVDIKAKIAGQSLGLINLFTDEIRWINGEAEGDFQIKSLGGKISADGELLINKGVWHIKQLNSDIGMGKVSLEAQNGLISLNEFSGYLYTSTNKISPFSIYGAIDLHSNQMEINLVDGKISVDIPKQFSGDLSMKGIKIAGPIEAPTIYGKATLADSLIYLLQAQQGQQNVLPLGLSLELNLGKNVYITTGSIDIANLSSVLNSILLNIEATGDKVRILGELNKPQIKGTVYFNRGIANIFSREFTLLSPAEQTKFYPLSQEKVSYNYAEFTGSLMPYLNIAALVKVQSVDERNKDQSTGFPLKKDIFIISHLVGVPLSKEKEKAIKLEFEAFEPDTNQAISGYRQTALTQDNIKILLLPDFIKGIAGEKGSPQTDANAMVADYLNSQLQTMMFRGIERQLEQSLGLESLTLNYNFGKDLRRALGSKDMSLAEKQTFGVGFVKGFYDKLFIEVRYAQALEDPSTAKQTTSINYQITYKLSPGLSVSYYKEPVSINTITEGYNKVSLRTGFLF